MGPENHEIKRLKDEIEDQKQRFSFLADAYNKQRAESAIRENEQTQKIKIIGIGALVIIALLLVVTFRCLHLVRSDGSISATDVTAEVNEAKENGYQDGYKKGQQDGYDSGYEKGCNETEAKHYNDYNNGYNVGYRDGLNASAEEIQSTLPDRYDEGYNAGKLDGYQAGFDAGKAAVSSYSEPTTSGNTQAVVSTPDPAPQQEAAPTAATYDYIINTNTGKFHYSWCKSVAKMSEKNKWYYTGTRDSVINMGYVPCKNCNP